MKKYIFTILMMFCITSIFAQSNPANYLGSGTATNPYEIYSNNDLQNISVYLTQYRTAYFKLMNDLNLSGIVHSPIGTSSVLFAGNFDGNGRTISNLAGNDKHLFRNLASGGIIKNVIITNANITTAQTTADMAILVLNNKGTIENCYVQGRITAPTVDNIGYGKGGIAATNDGTIRNCFVNVILTGRHRLAGIVGKNFGTVEKCYSTGQLLGTDQINGGIVGQNNSVVRNCVNIMPVITGLHSSGDYGTYRVYSYQGTGSNNYSLNTTTINGSTVTGTSSNYNGQNVTDAQLKTQSFWQSIGYDFVNIWKMSSPTGTFKGYPIFKWQETCEYKIYTVADLITLSNQVSAGDSKAGCTILLMNNLNLSGVNFPPIGTTSVLFAGNFEGNGYTISNLAGNDKHLFRNLASGGTIKNVMVSNANITTAQTTADMAILVLNNKGTIENCYVQGRITAPTVDNIGYGKGGIAATNDGTIKNCFVNVILTGRHRLAGIVGKNFGTVEKCYSTGQILGTDQINGGIVGQNNSVVRNCVNIMPVIRGLHSSGNYGTYRVYSYQGTGSNNYSLNTTTINGSTVSTGTTSNYNGQNVTDAQLKTQSFWQSIGYDFVNIWKMSSPGSSFKGYPIFKWQNECTIEIYTVADLINLSNQVSAGDSKAGCTVSLMNSLNLSGVNFPPIGTSSVSFAGNFEGNGYTISNLAGNDKHLFRNLATGGNIKNVIIINANITTAQTTTDMAILVLNNKGTIENCYVQGKITAPTVDNIGYGKGGIAATNDGTIKNCFVNVILTGRHRLAGIVGKNFGTVEKCYSTGQLLGTDQINGGIVGQNNSLVRNCVNIMPVITGLHSSGNYGTYRVYSYQGTGSNNYSLNTTTINGSTVTGTTSNYNGQNATITQLRTQSFWESIGYDFRNIWKMSSSTGSFKGYPIFKWQTDTRGIAIKEPIVISPITDTKSGTNTNIYPNPTTGIVNIVSTNEKPDIKVYSVTGQLLIQTTKTTIDLSPYPSGIYIFNINGETEKIVKQ